MHILYFKKGIIWVCVLGVTVLGVTRKDVTPWTIFGIPWTKGT